jgi:hypothetical protein
MDLRGNPRGAPASGPSDGVAGWLCVARHALSVLVGATPAQWSPPDFELEHDAEFLAAQRHAVTTSEASLKLSQEAYAAGRGSLLQVLDSQRLFSQAVLGYARAKGQRYLDTALLFQSMGGASLDWLGQTEIGSR